MCVVTATSVGDRERRQSPPSGGGALHGGGGHRGGGAEQRQAHPQPLNCGESHPSPSLVTFQLTECHSAHK